jgi:predicted DNA-binding transcriptional regulator AlpA
VKSEHPQQSEKLLTKKQFAAKLGYVERTVDRHLQQGIYPQDIKVVIGGGVRFRESVADHWIAEGCPGASQ